jgi:predicted dehydrogenase
MEVNAHEIDFMRFVMGDAVQVYAAGGKYVREENDFPDVALVSVTFQSGSVGLLHSSMASVMGGYGGRLDCTEGSVVFPSFWGKQGEVRCQRHDGEEAPVSVLSEEESPVTQEIRAFAEAVLKGEDPPVTGADGRAATEIALAAYQSIDACAPVRLPYKE